MQAKGLLIVLALGILLGHATARTAAVEKGRYVHRYDVAREAMRQVSEGNKFYLTQYLLNPDVGFADFRFTFTAYLLILALRFSLAGANHPRSRHFESIFHRLFGRFAKERREPKLCENLWYSLWHTFSFCFGLYVLYQEGLTPSQPGWTRTMLSDWDLSWYWFPTPAEQSVLGNPGWPLFPVSPAMKAFYLIEMAFWCSCLTFLWFETIRDDFNALMLHHFVTVTLIGFSYVCSFWRIGIVVQLIHDVADIVLYGAKALHYTKAPAAIVDCLFVLFALSFFLSRLVFFPVVCLWPALDLSNMDVWLGTETFNAWQIPGGVVLPGFLCVLQMLHVFWFGLIIKMIVRTLRGKKVSEDGDIRSDDEAEDDDVPSDQVDAAYVTPVMGIPDSAGQFAVLKGIAAGEMGTQRRGTTTDRSRRRRRRGSGSSDDSSSRSEDVRMALSSLPGVRATTIPERRQSATTKRTSRQPKRPTSRSRSTGPKKTNRKKS